MGRGRSRRLQHLSWLGELVAVAGAGEGWLGRDGWLRLRRGALAGGSRRSDGWAEGEERWLRLGRPCQSTEPAGTTHSHGCPVAAAIRSKSVS